MQSAAESALGSDARGERRIKLCMLLPHHWSGTNGGSEYQASLLADRLSGTREVEISYLTVTAATGYDPGHYRIVRFSAHDGIRRYGHFFDAFRLYDALAREAPDVIYQQVGCAYTGIAAYYARRYGCRMFWRVASDDDVTPRRLDWRRPHHIVERRFLEYGLRHADFILAQTRRQQALLAANYGREDSILVRNFHPAPSEHPRKAAGPIKRIAWVANLRPIKNPEAFIRLAARFSERQDTKFVVVGTFRGKKEWVDEIKTAMSRLPNLEHAGELSQEGVNAILQDSYALVNTSHIEGFSNVFIQAWMRGVPVVSLNVNPDGFLDGKNFGFASGSEQQLYEDIATLLNDPALQLQMGERAREMALAEFSEANIDRIADLLGLAPRRN